MIQAYLNAICDRRRHSMLKKITCETTNVTNALLTDEKRLGRFCFTPAKHPILLNSSAELTTVTQIAKKRTILPSCNHVTSTYSHAPPSCDGAPQALIRRCLMRVVSWSLSEVGVALLTNWDFVTFRGENEMWKLYCGGGGGEEWQIEAERCFCFAFPKCQMLLISWVLCPIRALSTMTETAKGSNGQQSLRAPKGNTNISWLQGLTDKPDDVVEFLHSTVYPSRSVSPPL